MLKSSEVFRDLHPKLQAVLEKYGYIKPTPIQEKSIPLILMGKSVIISAPTGSGKTEAALFPIFSMMVEQNSWKGNPLMVYITPMRALNRDIYVRMREISNEMGLRSIVRHGDSSRKERREFTEGKHHWFITTPESFSIIVTHRAFKNIISDIRWVVIDEVHELIENERGAMLSVVLERLRKKIGSFQLVAISATISKFNTVKKLLSCSECAEIKENEMKKMIIDVRSIPFEENESEDINYKVIKELRKIMEQKKSTILFTNTRDTAEFLSYKFRELGYKDVEVHHGSLSASVRTEAEKKLKEGSLKGIIATSSLELGIDIGAVDQIIQFNSPRQVLRLIQRIGRSGHRLGSISRGTIFSIHDITDMLESVVIARRAFEGKYEDLNIVWEPLDVALHQAVGMVLAGDARREEEILEVLRKAYPFKDLSGEKLNEILNFASNIGLLKISENGEILPGYRSREYYYSTNMIADTRKVPVMTVNNELVGSLDAEFVFSELENDRTFILRGREWKVLSIEDDRIIVEEVEEHKGLPPSWTGDLIPVSRNVAREAISLLRRICYGEPFEKIRAEYRSLTSTVYENIMRVCGEQQKRGFILPHPDHLVVEKGEDESLTVIHVPLGTKGNFTLALILGKYILSRMGGGVSIKSDPYKLFIEKSSLLRTENLEDSIYGLASQKEYELDEMLRSAIKESNAFRYRMILVARKMGALGENYSIKDSKKILRYYKDTVVGEEALREIMFEKTDMEVVLKLLRGIREGWIKIIKQPVRGLSPYTLHSIRGENPISYAAEGIPRELALKTLEMRIMEKEVIMKCLSCGYEWRSKIKDLPMIIECGKCRSRAVVPIPPGNLEFLTAVREGLNKKKLDGKKKEYFDEAVKRAKLVINYGKNAVIALAPYGVGPRSASRALSKLKLGWKNFIEALYDEEKNYIKNRKYWDQ
ncbi:MAG: DEAD/DEAH box helicase [Fervidicoccaceae archaeon]